MLTYKSRDGDIVDDIATRHYGECTPAVLRAVFEANPGLADHGAVLSRDVNILLPTIDGPTELRKGVTLWD